MVSETGVFLPFININYTWDKKIALHFILKELKGRLSEASSILSFNILNLCAKRLLPTLDLDEFTNLTCLALNC